MWWTPWAGRTSSARWRTGTSPSARCSPRRRPPAGAPAAAAAGACDLLALPAGTRAKRVGLTHAAANVAVILLFAAVWVVRLNADSRAAGGALIAIEVVAVAILGVSAWLGGELVDRLGVGVDPEHDLNAPSSLRSPSATQRIGDVR